MAANETLCLLKSRNLSTPRSSIPRCKELSFPIALNMELLRSHFIIYGVPWWTKRAHFKEAELALDGLQEHDQSVYSLTMTKPEHQKLNNIRLSNFGKTFIIYFTFTCIIDD
jgi:hypothetical protein